MSMPSVWVITLSEQKCWIINENKVPGYGLFHFAKASNAPTNHLSVAYCWEVDSVVTTYTVVHPPRNKGPGFQSDLNYFKKEASK